MTESKNPRWRTAITEVEGDNIFIRGYDFLQLAEKVDYASAVFLLFTGELPTAGQAKVLNGMLVLTCDHGIAPSEAVTRVVAASGSPVQAAIAAGLLTIGDVHGGAGEAVARDFQTVLAEGKKEGRTIEQIAAQHVARCRAAGRRVDGYGHPLHPSGDPRGPWLLKFAEQHGVCGEYAGLARAIEKSLQAAVGRPIPINVDGAMAAVLSDMGLDWRCARALMIIPRTAGLAAHAIEEAVRERGWRVVAAEDEVEYDGPPRRELP